MALVLAAGAAQAAACCLSASAFGTGRLAIWESAAIGMNASVAPSSGGWDVHGDWQSWDGYSEREWRLTSWFLLRAHERWQLGARVPVLLNERTAGGLSERGGGAGDLGVNVRWEALAIGEWMNLPGVALTAGLTAPSGRTLAQSRTVLGSDVTGRGTWAPSLAASVEWAEEIWFVRLDAGATVPLPGVTDDGRAMRLGPVVDVALGAGVEPVRGFVVSLSPRLSFEDALVVSGERVRDSGGHELALTLAASWKFHPKWTLQASADATAPVKDFGRNRAGRQSASLGVRYAFF